MSQCLVALGGALVQLGATLLQPPLRLRKLALEIGNDMP
jgi:hypothetical protein